MKMNRCFILKMSCVIIVSFLSGASGSTNLQVSQLPDASKYGTGDWDADSLGNHRVVVHVSEGSEAVWAHIPWRRRDTHPEEKAIIVVDGQTGEQITNVCRIQINREYGDLVFQPETVPGDYYVYYMPYITSGRSAYPTVTYRKIEETADRDWLQKFHLTSGELEKTQWRALPQAEWVQFQSIDTFNSYYPMEIIATAQEMDALLKKHKEASYLLFPEDRVNPIRMTRDLPYKWVHEGVREVLQGRADRGEFYAFQVGVYAARSDIKDIHVRFGDLTGQDGESSVPASAFTCFNTDGVDWMGRSMDKICSVDKSRVQPLWMGVQIPADLKAGRYESEVTVAPVDLNEKTICLVLDVSDRLLEDAGDSEPWRHSRLRWLNSRIGEDDGIVPPFIPMKTKGNTVSCLGRSVTLNKTGFPQKIQSFFSQEMTSLVKKGRDLLDDPIEFVVVDQDGKPLKWKTEGVRFIKRAEGAVAWEAINRGGPLTVRCEAQMEFDGSIEFLVTLTTSETVPVKDIRLDIPMDRAAAKYMMGMGFKGGYRPAEFQWNWDVKKNHDGIWIGDVNAGLQASFKDENYARPLNTNFYHSKPLNMPPSWYNDGQGGFLLNEENGKTVLLSSYSGSRVLEKEEAYHFHFRLLLTPFKLLNTQSHWHNRYYHRFKTVQEIAETGANTINVHHATEINPFINYPFIRPGEMKTYIDEAHRNDMKVKIYYTVRELSNIAPELFALRSLGDEILSHGPGGGFSWLQEHLDPDYIAGWLVARLKDAAVINSGVSRWHNYYLEGLNWVVKNVGIDGLYIDDVAFDRTVMKRLRKILDREKEGSLIDLHSANQYNVRDGFANSANLYMEHFPFINRLWFGEYFDYDSAPDFWLTEVSGIPFGLMGEMLQDGGNRWRGMIYGMTSRLPWAGDPRPLWKVWDDFGIQESRMIGCWVEDCPVQTDHKDVLATVYVKEDQTLVSLASWAESQVDVKLRLDWRMLGLDRKRVVIQAPAIQDFQDERQFSVDEDIPMEPGKGWLLIVREQ